MQIKEAINWAHEQLTGKSGSPRLDAELLLSHVLKRPNTFLLAHDEQKISSIKYWLFRRLVEKRRKGVPVAYLTGHREFFGLDFRVNRHVLIPRPDTEILVEGVIEYLRTSGLKNPVLLDVGTGSACIPIALLKNAEGLKAVATDVSRSALRVARKNVAKHHLKSRLHLIHSDLLEKVNGHYFAGKELIVTANLPYIPSRFEISSETRFEPHLALHGGEDGLDIYKRLMVQLQKLKPQAIFLELFEFQVATLATLLPGYELSFTQSMTGQAQLLVIERQK